MAHDQSHVTVINLSTFSRQDVSLFEADCTARFISHKPSVNKPPFRTGWIGRQVIDVALRPKLKSRARGECMSLAKSAYLRQGFPNSGHP